MVRDADRDVTELVEQARHRGSSPEEASGETADRPERRRGRRRAVPVPVQLRLVKDEWEIEQMRLAVAATRRGSRRSSPSCPTRSPRVAASAGSRASSGSSRGTRATGWATTRSRAAGDHACTLHWIRTRRGATTASCCSSTRASRSTRCYTADITRTLPGRTARSPRQQRKVYDAVLCGAGGRPGGGQPGDTFARVHDTGIRVIAEKLAEWGLLPGVSVEDTLTTRRPVPPALDGPRHQPPPRPRRPRLRAGPQGRLHGRRAASRAWS